MGRGKLSLEIARLSALPEDEIDRIEDGYHTTTDVIVKLVDRCCCSTDYLLGCGGGNGGSAGECEKDKEGSAVVWRVTTVNKYLGQPPIPLDLISL